MAATHHGTLIIIVIILQIREKFKYLGNIKGLFRDTKRGCLLRQPLHVFDYSSVTRTP